MKTRTRLNVVWLLLVGSLLALVAGCVAAPQTVGKEVVVQTVVVEKVVVVEKPVVVIATPAPAPAEEEMSSDQVLRIVWLGGMSDYTGLYHIKTIAHLPCFISDIRGDLIPGLCTHYEANEDDTVFRFFIDPRAVWADGKPVTAQDFIDWWEFRFHPDRTSWWAHRVMSPIEGYEAFSEGEVDTVSGLKALDEKTLEIRLVRSENWFPYRTVYVFAAPVRMDPFEPILEELEGLAPAEQRGKMKEIWSDENAKNLIANGPYQPTLLADEPTGRFTYELNPNWWGDVKPNISRIEVTAMRDFQTMLLMWENHEADLFMNIMGPLNVQLRKTEPEAFRQLYNIAFHGMHLVTDVPPMDDINLRKALMHAINWEEMNQVAYEGEHPPPNAGSFFPEMMPCYDPDFKPYPFDVEKAKEYLAKSKYGPTGATVPKIRIAVGTDAPRLRSAQIIVEYWRVHLGIEDVELKQQESEFMELGEQVTARVSSGGSPLPIPAMLFEQVGHSAGAIAQVAHSGTPEMDAKIEALLGMRLDDPAYCAETQAILKDLMDQVLTMPFNYLTITYQVKPWLKGPTERTQSSGLYTIPQMWLARR